MNSLIGEIQAVLLVNFLFSRGELPRLVVKKMESKEQMKTMVKGRRYKIGVHERLVELH